VVDVVVIIVVVVVVVVVVVIVVVVVVATDGNDAGLEDDEGLERSISVHAALRS